MLGLSFEDYCTAEDLFVDYYIQPSKWVDVHSVDPEDFRDHLEEAYSFLNTDRPSQVETELIADMERIVIIIGELAKISINTAKPIIDKLSYEVMYIDQNYCDFTVHNRIAGDHLTKEKALMVFQAVPPMTRSLSMFMDGPITLADQQIAEIPSMLLAKKEISVKLYGGKPSEWLEDVMEKVESAIPIIKDLNSILPGTRILQEGLERAKAKGVKQYEALLAASGKPC